MSIFSAMSSGNQNVRGFGAPVLKPWLERILIHLDKTFCSYGCIPCQNLDFDLLDERRIVKRKGMSSAVSIDFQDLF